MKKTIYATLLLLSSLCFSQSKKKDYLVTKNKDTIFCKILKLSGKKIEYIKENENSSSRESIYNFLDANIIDLSVIENPLGIKIEQPEKGYSYVYLYRPYAYTGSVLNCKVEYNGTSLVNLKTKSYYLHKVKANEIHKYNWNNSTGTVIEINAKDGETYFIRASFGGTGDAFLNNFNSSNSLYIFEDNPKIAKYVILTMEKESPTY